MNEEQNIPSGWQGKMLGSFIEFKNGINADSSAYGHGVKFVNIMDIFKKATLFSDDILGLVSITERQLKESSVIKGDILFNRTSEIMNEIAFSSVYMGDETITFGGFVIRGRQIKSLLSNSFARYCFTHPYIRKEMIRSCQGVVRANIGQKDLSKIFILIPPPTEQQAIANILQTWDNAIEKTEALIVAKEKQFEWLTTYLINKS